jgi:hypothetical protein
MKNEGRNTPEREEERLRGALRSLERVDAGAEFQRRLRADFTSGRILETARTRRRQASILPFRGRSAWRWAAAAVLVVALGVSSLARRTSWEVMNARGAGEVVVQGSAVPIADADALGPLLAAGGRLETRGDVELDLLGDDSLALGLAPGTAVQIQRPPARWFGRNTEVRVFAGEVRLLTGPEFPGAHLVLRTPEGMVRVTGTAVAVYRDSTLTCVCVLEGTAAIGVDAENLDDVPAGKRKVLFADSRDPVILDIAPQHEKDLQAFVERARPRFTARQP